MLFWLSALKTGNRLRSCTRSVTTHLKRAAILLSVSPLVAAPSESCGC